MDKFIFAIRKGQHITSVHTVIKLATAQLGKAVTPAELWMAIQTRRFLKFPMNTGGCIGPNSTAASLF